MQTRECAVGEISDLRFPAVITRGVRGGPVVTGFLGVGDPNLAQIAAHGRDRMGLLIANSR